MRVASSLSGVAIALLGMAAFVQWPEGPRGAVAGDGPIGTGCRQADSCVPGAFFTAAGDQNCDGRVDGTDVDLIIAGLYCDVCAQCDGDDANQDGRVSVADVVADLRALGAPTPTAPIPATPTPTATATPTATSVAPGFPVAVDDATATLVGEPVDIFVLANDSDPNGDPLNVAGFTQPANGSVVFADNVATYTARGAFIGTDVFTYTISDGMGGTASAGVTVVVNELPPDPADVAPPPANGVATIVADATRFLYTGASAVQFGVAPDTIDAIRAAVVRGKVRSRDGTALAGVRVTILDHPELGFTSTRADGMFDMAVNGGGLLTLNYEKTGFCPVQRRLAVAWQDYAMAPDVVMTELDPVVTSIDFGGGSAMQMAHGSTQSDANGTRTAMVMFMPGTSADLVMPDGTKHAADSLHIRATEFTVGPSGPAAMPAELPPTSAYTYCVEFSADEAMAAGATTVAFSQPVVNYVENFLGFPVGIAVPTGFYDRQKAAWVPSANGRVVKILSIAGGIADVDTDGDDVADDALGIGSEERRNLATLYAAGQTLWRVPLPHFSVVDENWSFVPDDATSPGQSGAGADDGGLLEDPGVCEGCVIEMENQVLGDSAAVVGTPYDLNYRSDRVPGRIRSRTFTLSGASVPASLLRIELHLAVGGRTFDQTFPPDPDQRFTFVWDGQDAYGRTLLGGQPLRGSIDYVYPVNYAGSNTDPAFSVPGGFVLLENPARQEFIVSEPFGTVIGEGLTDARVVGLGGWTLSVQHFFDPVARVLHLGDGTRRRADSVSRIIDEVAGSEDNQTRAVAVGPDGSIYFSTFNDIRRLARDGTVTVVAGGGDFGLPEFGDDGPATEAFVLTEEIALGPDGSLYFSQSSAVRRVGPDGIIRRVAGRYCTGGGKCPVPGPDGGLATETDLGGVGPVAVGPDGSLYVPTSSATKFGQLFTRVRRIGADGIVTTVAGIAEACNLFGEGICGDGGPATEAQLFSANAVTVAPDGSLYISDSSRIRRVRADGIIEPVAGSGFGSGLSGDGGLATGASLCSPLGVTVAADGSVYIADRGNNRVRRIDPQGIIQTFAGSGPSSCNSGGTVVSSGDGGPALAAVVSSPFQVALDPDGLLYVTDVGERALRIRRIGAAFPGVSQGDFVVASEDGSQLYVFDRSGRHLRTLDALTGAVLFELAYDADGRLARVTEKTGGTDNVTTIQHDGAGNPSAIVGPFGQTTTLAVDAGGFLAGIVNPAGEEMQFTSGGTGLLASKADARGKTTTFTFDPEGRLIRDADPAGGTQDLERVETSDAVAITNTTGLERTTTYEVGNRSGNVQHRTITAPDGTQSQRTESIDAATTQITFPDGTIEEATLAADPRFGIQSPVTAALSLRFPSSLQFSAARTRTAVLTNAADPLSLVSITDTTTVEGRMSTNTYTAATRTFVNTTPAGRTQTVTLDTLGRYTAGQFADLAPLDLAYDVRGRLETTSIGTGVDARTSSFTYDEQGFLETASDHTGRTARFTYDAAGRITSHTLADGNAVGFGFDAAGNLTSLTPPGRPAHAFAYSDRNELTVYTPPSVPGTGPTTFVYDADRAITRIDRAGAQSIAITYDPAGRPIARTLTSAGNAPTMDTFGYDAAGRIADVVAASGVTCQYSYDGLLPTGQTWSGPIAGSVAHTFDNSLRLASQSVNGGNAILFTYDDDGLSTGAGDLVTVRDPQNGLPVSSTLGAVTSTLDYNDFGEVTEHAVSVSGSPVYRNVLDRNGVGRIIRKIETIAGEADTLTYTYDSIGQLTSVSRNDAEVESYAYDANGNRVSATVDRVTVAATYDAQDRLVQYGGVTHAFNAAGDLVGKTDGADSTTYDYDAAGNLLGVTLESGTSITYVIDGQNRRLGKRVDGALVQGLLYADSFRPVAELDGSGALVSRFVYAGRTVPAYMIKGGVTHRLISDHLGSVRLVVNSATGAIVQRMDYDAFGNVTRDTAPGFQPFGFAGGLYDPDTGLTRFGARDYDAATGRWTAKDPKLFGGGDANLYRYAGNDPINFVDPLGTGRQVELESLIAFLRATIEDLTTPPTPSGGTGLVPYSETEVSEYGRAVNERRALRRVYEQELAAARAELRGILVQARPQLNCGGFVSKALSALSFLDFAVVFQRSLDSGRSFFEELDVQAADQKEDQFKAGIHTTVNFFGPFVLVQETI